MKTTLLALVSALGAAAAFSAQAQYTPIDISSAVNQDMQNYANGANYPLGGSLLTVAGVPFRLSTLDGNPATTGVVQVPRDYTGNTYAYTFTVPTGTHATALYSLMNSAAGWYGINEGSLVVTGTHGETATLNLIEGINLRDHNNDIFCDTLSDDSVVSTYFSDGSTTTASSQSRLDRQVLTLPDSFSGDTIATITFYGIDNPNYGGEPFLAGLTLASPVPEPSMAGLASLGALLALNWFKSNGRKA